MVSHEKYWVLIPAAGVGSRMNSETPKQYLQLCGQSILKRTLDIFLNNVLFEKVVLVLHPQDTHFAHSDVCPHGKLQTTIGGKERQDSVLQGLLALADVAAADDWVLVHDAARPCLTLTDINKLLQSLRDCDTGGILASPVRDTLKRATADNKVDATLDRKNYYLAATPQMFRYGRLLQAMQNASDRQLHVTDEAAAMEAMQWSVKLVTGRSDNIKITESEDIALAEYLLLAGDHNIGREYHKR